MPHAAFYVLGPHVIGVQQYVADVSMPHAAFYVLGLCRPQPLSHQG